MKCIYVIVLTFLFPMCRMYAQDKEQAIQKWRIGVSGGAGYIVASSKEAVNTFVGKGIDRAKAQKGIDQLRWQTQFGADAHYMIKPEWGVGLKYLFAKNGGSIDDVVLNMNDDGITNTVGDIESTYFLNYIGPSFVARSFLGNTNKLALTGIVSFGYSHLRIEQVTIQYPAIGTSATFGAFTTIGLEYYLTKRLSLGCDLGLFSSSFKKFTYKDRYATRKYDLGDNRENISNINLSLNLRIHI